MLSRILVMAAAGALITATGAQAQWQNNALAIRTTGSVLRAGDPIRVELVALEPVFGPFSAQVTYRFARPIVVKDEDGQVSTRTEEQAVTRPPTPVIDRLEASQLVLLDDTFHLGDGSAPGTYRIEVGILEGATAGRLATIRSCVVYAPDATASTEGCEFMIGGVDRVNAEGWVTFRGRFPPHASYRAALMKDGRMLARLETEISPAGRHELDVSSPALAGLSGTTVDFVVHEFFSNSSTTLGRLTLMPKR